MTTGILFLVGFWVLGGITWALIERPVLRWVDELPSRAGRFIRRLRSTAI